jgi:SAM-dependent methyltransferase
MVALKGGLIPDFSGADDSAVETIWAWPEGFLHHARPWLAVCQAGDPLPPQWLAQLQSAGLVDANSIMTPLGKTTVYHLEEYELQGSKEQFLPQRFLESLTPGSRVVDIGCGAGQTLQRLRSFGQSELIGLDIDLSALAVGCRIDEGSARPIRFVCSSAEALPFADNQFTHAICRVAINYMHQGRALREMARIVKPGGLISVHVEGPGFDWQLVRSAANARALVCRLRDAAIGVALALTGWQPAPGARFSGGRAFGTVRRFKKVVAQAGCEIIDCELMTHRGRLVLGFNALAKR